MDEPVRAIRGLEYRSVKFVDVNNGIVVGSDGVILKTTDGGTNLDRAADRDNEILIWSIDD